MMDAHTHTHTHTPSHLASWENHLYFGGCPVGQSRQATFTLTNHSSRMAVRFNWSSSPPELSFSPALGHLHPCSSKDITVTFKADKTLSFEKAAVSGKLQKITFSQPISQVCGCLRVSLGRHVACSCNL